MDTLTSEITLSNDFHMTTVTLRIGPDKRLTPGQVRRARMTLCGIDGCTCGGDCGERGPGNPYIVVGPDGAGQIMPDWQHGHETPEELDQYVAESEV